MPHITPKIEVTWDQNLTPEQVKEVKRKVLLRYPDANFFTIIINEENVAKLILRHHDPIAIDNLVKAVNFFFEHC